MANTRGWIKITPDDKKIESDVVSIFKEKPEGNEFTICGFAATGMSVAALEEHEKNAF